MTDPTATVYRSTITCPWCSHKKTETMPTDECVIVYDCDGCGARLVPLAGKPTIRKGITAMTGLKKRWTGAVLRKMLIAVVLIGAAASCDSATGPTTTRSDTFEISFSEGTNVPWSHEVDLGPGSWSSAEVLNCREVRPNVQSWACDSYTLQLSGSVMMFSGTKVNQFARVIRVTWEATGSV